MNIMQAVKDAELMRLSAEQLKKLLVENKHLKSHISALESLLDTAALNKDEDWRTYWCAELAAFYPDALAETKRLQTDAYNDTVNRGRG